MEGYKVLITTSGIGSRLGNLTKYTNKSLVRIGKKPSLSYIIESYPKNTEFVITLGHFGDHVKQFLKLAYPKLKVKFVKIDNYEGSGSSLLYTMSKCKKYLKQSFIFHACDTVVEKQNINLLNNWVGGVRNKGSFQYRTISSKNGKLININEKGESEFDYTYIGICGIKDYKIFWDYLEIILKENINQDLSDCHVIKKMLSDTNFDVIEYKNWHDIGNIDSLKEARKTVSDKFDLLDKDDESIFIFDDKVIKFFSNTDICKDRVHRGKKLYPLVPKIINSFDNFYSYEYIVGKVLAKTITISKMKKLLSWAYDNLWKEINDDSLYEKRCLDFYKSKTKDRVLKFLQSNCNKEKVEFINGELVPPVMEMLDMVDYKTLSSKTPKIFHGDFILENILETSTDFILLDWRQNFGGTTKYGDFYYDLAKLNSNLILDHSSVYNKNYECRETAEGIKCQILIPSLNMECKEVLKEFCKNKNIDYSNLNIITSLIWLSMSSLHEHPFDRFLYYFGRYNLYLHLLKNN